MKRIVILGSTGSIGLNTLRVVDASPGRFAVVGLAAGGSVAAMARQVRKYRPEMVAMADTRAAERLRGMVGHLTVVIGGAEASSRLIGECPADLVVSAIVGAAGLKPTFRAIGLGLPVAVANKEPLVMAGELMMAEARRSGSLILPLDSEHHAVATAMAGHARESVESIILTASGGPFLGKSGAELRRVTVAGALNHPRWKMGPKISVDSATLMNKGLEIIEARWLFDMPADRIEVVIHPESIIHGCVRFVDGGVAAFLSNPDMRLPIAAALHHPALSNPGLARLDFARLGRLTFRKPDTVRFPALTLARMALDVGGGMPAVLNAANEVAVGAFLEGRIRFTAIAEVVRRVMECRWSGSATSVEEVLEVDGRAREEARSAINTGRKPVQRKAP
jgi:1-deoxy-D-xylulose-5-phosphate reductoisomerase